jgi:hypothetical protein
MNWTPERRQALIRAMSREGIFDVEHGGADAAWQRVLVILKQGRIVPDTTNVGSIKTKGRELVEKYLMVMAEEEKLTGGEKSPDREDWWISVEKELDGLAAVRENGGP